MSSRGPSASCRILEALFTAAIVSGTAGAPRAARAAPDGEDVPLAVDAGLGPSFRSVVAEAADRLGREPCRLLLREFVSRATGRPLAESLDATGLAPAQYVRSIRFRSGRGLSPCGAPGMLAYTSPGSRAVVVCPGPLAGFRTGEGTSTVVVVLHEALHSLGLGEDPPSSREITAAVRGRCGE